MEFCWNEGFRLKSRKMGDLKVFGQYTWRGPREVKLDIEILPNTYFTAGRQTYYFSFIEPVGIVVLSWMKSWIHHEDFWKGPILGWNWAWCLVGTNFLFQLDYGPSFAKMCGIYRSDQLLKFLVSLLFGFEKKGYQGQIFTFTKLLTSLSLNLWYPASDSL